MSDEIRIKLTGYSDPDVVTGIFASSLVDVAYVAEVTRHCIFVVTEPDVNLHNASDYEWVKSVIRQVFENEHQPITIELDGATG